MAKKSAKSKGYRRQNGKKPYLSKKEIWTLCVLAALLAVGAFFLFRYDDGALKVQDGAVVTDGDNWLIVNGSNTRGGRRYYKLGEVGEIDGYSREKSPLETDANLAEYAFTPQGGDDGLRATVGCSHNPAKAMADYTRSTMVDLGSAEIGEVQSAELSGRTAHYFIATSKPAENSDEKPAEEAADAGDAPAGEETAEDGSPAEAPAEATEGTEGAASDRFTKTLSAYIDAAYNSCVIVHVESKADTADGCLSDEALTTLAEQAIAALTFEEGK